MKNLYRLTLGAICCFALVAPLAQASAATSHKFTGTSTGEPNLNNRPEFKFTSGLNNSCGQITLSGTLVAPGPTGGTIETQKFSNCFIIPSWPAITITSLGPWKFGPGPAIESVRFHVSTGYFTCQYDVTGNLYPRTTSETVTGAVWTFPEALNKEVLTVSNATGSSCAELTVKNGLRASFVDPKGMQVSYLN